jgi:hypothetical protein
MSGQRTIYGNKTNSENLLSGGSVSKVGGAVPNPGLIVGLVGLKSQEGGYYKKAHPHR